MIFEILGKLNAVLTSRERKAAVGILGLTFFVAVVDAVGLLSVMPFIAALSGEEALGEIPALQWIYNFSGITEYRDFLFIFGSTLLCFLIFSTAFRALVIYCQIKFVQEIERNLTIRLFKFYLLKPYSWYLGKNGSELAKNVLLEIELLVGKGIMPLFTLFTQGLIAFLMTAALLVADPAIAIFAATLVGSLYAIVLRLSRKHVLEHGEIRKMANAQRMRIVTESFSAIKEIKLRDREDFFEAKFSTPAFLYAKSQTISGIMGQIPRYIIEGLAFGGLVSICLAMVYRDRDLISALPTLTLFAIAAYRLLPAMQQVYNAITQLRYSRPAVRALASELFEASNLVAIRETDRMVLSPERNSRGRIELDNISLHYPDSKSLALRNINLEIKPASMIGIVGETGSGKTTAIDVILGLLEPDQGQVLLAGKPLKIDSEWRRRIGYVPQNIFISDDTIAANIAFGIRHEDIDMNRVQAAATTAHIHDFISHSLADGYNTTLGDRGVRISGGERQRIGIARALYQIPEILVLDEATSALDNLTEQLVMNAVQNIGREIIVIIIAHRLKSVMNCDTIYFFDNGAVKSHGTYEELLDNDPKFAELVTGGDIPSEEFKDEKHE